MEGDGDLDVSFKDIFGISIHALRVEGDILGILASRSHVISIHALRGEGDTAPRAFTTHCPTISIHALRVEGDDGEGDKLVTVTDFYPRPPGGGRQGERT